VSKKVYVGNLPPTATETSLSCKFSEHGKVVSVRMITDHGTGRSLGYAFVEMATPRDARRLIGELDGQSYDGQMLTVKMSMPTRV
jgi:RNA recognition motif-containing protein